MTTHDPLHRQTWDLIPWLVNETLDDARREIVENHLNHCSDCREELAFQRNVHAGVAEDSSAPDGAAPVALARLFERIDAEDEAIPDRGAFDPFLADIPRAGRDSDRRERRIRVSHLLAAAVIVEAIGLVGLGTMLAGQRDAASSLPAYVTLSEGRQAPANASIRLVPAPSLSLGDLQSLLGEAGLRIVDSNAGGTILALGFASHSSAPATDEADTQRRRIDAALRQLRTNNGVLLAEPMVSAAASSH